MASPRRAERKKAELRREIIDAAFDCFAERGYHATVIADVAARLGIGHGTCYRYFENKRDIVEHVITDLYETIVSSVADYNTPQAVQMLADYRIQFARTGEALGAVVARDPRIARMVQLEAP